MSCNEENHIYEENRMRLGNFEFVAMNNYPRRLIQKYYEMRIFRNMLNHEGISLYNSDILDAGCGSGYSTKLILEIFEPSKIIAFDYMPEQIALAKKREIPVDFFVGDIRKTDLPDGCVDAVFIFGVLHHISNYRAALKEMDRILKKQGVLLVEEPRRGFSWRSFEKGIKESGFSILQKRSVIPFYFQSYLCQKK